MNPNSCEALPGNYRQTREIDFVNLSRENIIGLLLTLALLVGPVLLVLPSHPFTLLSSAKNTVFSLIYCLGAFLLMVASMRLQAKLHGFCLYKTCGCPVEYVSMGFYIVACTGRMYVRRNSWLTGTLIPAVVWCGLLLAAAFAVSEQGVWIISVYGEKNTNKAKESHYLKVTAFFLLYSVIRYLINSFTICLSFEPAATCRITAAPSRYIPPRRFDPWHTG